jgi:hypothetical protein
MASKRFQVNARPEKRTMSFLNMQCDNKQIDFARALPGFAQFSNVNCRVEVITLMAAPEKTSFNCPNCPNCNAVYKVEAAPQYAWLLVGSVERVQQA